MYDYAKSSDQLLIIDETHKSRNEGRRRRAWGLKGQTPILPTYFEENFRKRYTMIGAANVHEFVKSACEIIERDDTDDRGTVDTEAKLMQFRWNLVCCISNFFSLEPDRFLPIQVHHLLVWCLRHHQHVL